MVDAWNVIFTIIKVLAYLMKSLPTSLSNSVLVLKYFVSGAAKSLGVSMIVSLCFLKNPNG